MEYDRYVVSRPLAQRLKELKFPQHTIFYWVKRNNQWDIIDIESRNTDYDIQEFTAAHTSGELKEYFPPSIWLQVSDTSIQPRKAMVIFAKFEGLYVVTVMVADKGGKELFELHRVTDKNEANACALMLIYLLENQMTSYIH